MLELSAAPKTKAKNKLWCSPQRVLLQALGQLTGSLISPKLSPPTVVMTTEISYRDQNRFLYQTVSMFISAGKLDTLTLGLMGIDSLLKPASRGHSKLYS